MKRILPSSFRWRLALLSAAISGLILGIFGFAAWLLIHRQLERSLEARISVPLSRMVAQLGGGMDWKREIESRMPLAGSFVRSEDFEIAVFENRSDGYAYYSDGSRWMNGAIDMESFVPDEATLEKFKRSENERRPPDNDRRGPLGNERRPPGRGRNPLPPLKNPVFVKAVTKDGAAWRIGIQSNPEVTVYLAMSLSEFSQEEQRLRRFFLAALPVGLLAIVGGGLLIAGRAIRPIRRVTEAATQMNAVGLGRRIPRTGRESGEFSRLIDVLNDMMARLEKSFQQATRFTADASHELKTPIALMQAEISDALKNCPPDSAEAAAFRSLGEETHRLKQIVQSLLLLSQVDSGGLKMHPEPVDLSHEMHGLCEDAEVLCHAGGLTFSSRIAPDVRVSADRILLMQAVQNLLSNAVKYNRPDGSVRCELTQQDGHTLIRFTNTGAPIPLEKQEHIFDRFFRVDSARNQDVDGFGLGLDLAREIIRSHGGDLTLVRSRGDETVFEIRLEP